MMASCTRISCPSESHFHLSASGSARSRGFTPGSEAKMRWVHMTIIVLFVAVTLIFLVQIRETVSMDCLGFGVRRPLALMAAIFYLLGAMTGSSAFALLRRS